MIDIPPIKSEEEIAFLTVEQVIALHDAGIRQYSPTESFAIRDQGLLESAAMTPQQTFDGEFLYPTLAAMAGAYVVGLTLNHPFENGNKRVALGACSTFLRMNGYQLTLTQGEAADMILQVISHALDRDGLTDLLNNSIAPL